MIRFVPVFLSTLFLSANLGTVLYVNSSLLSQFFEPNTVSLLFVFGAVGNIVLFLFIPRIIEQFSKKLPLILLLILALISTMGMALAQNSLVAALSFVSYSSVLFVIFYFFDIFLEEISIDTNTGETRGAYLTILNLGIAIGPVVVALVSVEDNLELIYIAASLLVVPAILLAIFAFESKQPKWHGLHHRHAFLPLKLWWQTKNLRRVTLAKLVLEFFFALMVIYTPIYLHETLGFAWSELGIIFAVMLLPFILFEWPAGELADRLWGEREIMATGFIITASSLVVMPFLGKSFFIWMAILFISRVGASLVEATTDSYFFKNVDAHDTRLLSIFRLTRPVSIMLGALAGVLVLNFLSFEKLFFILALIVMLGFRESLKLRDTL